MVQIFWKDLTAEKQQEIIAEFGDNCNFDVFPIAELQIDEVEDEDSEDDEFEVDFEDEE